MLAEHQRDAVTRASAALEQFGAVLLADEAGLGKSFVAAELIRRANEDGGRVELIVPASLVSQWNDTLAAFGARAEVVTHDGVHHALEGPRPSLIVVDEAHAFRNPLTNRYDALARRAAASPLLLVTATPICNGLGDLHSLVRLMAPDDLLAFAGVPSIDAAFALRDRFALDVILRSLVIRRARDVLPPALAFGGLERRVVRHRLFTAGGDIPRLVDALAFPLIGETAMLRRFLWRRLESSEAAILESIARQLRFYERALSCLAAGRLLPKRDYRAAFGREEDREAFQQVLFWELFAPPGTIGAGEIEEEMTRLRKLAAAVASSPLEKRQMLVDLVRTEGEPVLLFTGSAATAQDLYGTLRGVCRCGVVTSRANHTAATLRAFCDGRIDVLVSTDMSAEGLNLQRAGVVVHYDIPWNPVRLDQRNGRAYRIGQQRPSVRAVYFLPEEDPTSVIATVASKNRTRRAVLRPGDSAPEIEASTLRPRVSS
ncbi:MAG: DEAD/DEAH box helicase, partial [Thermoanaerobaculia bacterium]